MGTVDGAKGPFVVWAKQKSGWFRQLVLVDLLGNLGDFGPRFPFAEDGLGGQFRCLPARSGTKHGSRPWTEQQRGNTCNPQAVEMNDNTRCGAALFVFVCFLRSTHMFHWPGLWHFEPYKGH